ncbi:MAG: protein kinase domain-containing protein [Oligoflexus sp.]
MNLAVNQKNQNGTYHKSSDFDLDINIFDPNDPRLVYSSNRGQIYKVTHKLDHQKYAILKVLREEFPDSKSIGRFKNEFEIAHNICADCTAEVYELIYIQDRHAILMEYLPFPTIESQISNIQQLDMLSKMRLSCEIVKSLAQVHNHNVLHKDINPSNILFDPNSFEVKIIDFGISSYFPPDTPVLEVANELCGTLKYVAPEQTSRTNIPISFQSDLYSLGITLFEIFTGQLPFSSKDESGLIYSHIASPPPDPCLLCPDLPVVIGQIISKLMSKDPFDRYNSAIGLQKDFEACLKAYSGTGDIPLFSIGQSDRASVLSFPQKIFERQRQLAQIAKSIEHKNLTFTLIYGPSGIGKTALIDEFRRQNLNHYNILFGKCTHEQENIPYASLSTAFDELVNILLSASDEELTKLRQEYTEKHSRGIGIISQILPSTAKIFGEVEELNILNPAEQFARQMTALVEFLQVLGKTKKPLLLFFDDAQWLDQASFELLSYLSLLKNVTGIHVIMAVPDKDEFAKHPTISAISERHPIQEILIPSLSNQSIRELLSIVLQTSEVQVTSLAEIIHNKARGNVFFSLELIRKLYRDKIINYNFQTEKWEWLDESIRSVEVSDNVADLIISQLSDLDHNAKDILITAAVIGTKFSVKLLMTVLSYDQQDILSLLSKIQKLEILIRLSSHDHQSQDDKFDNDIEFQFSNHKIREALLGLLNKSEKNIKHARLGLALLDTREIESDVKTIAFHLNQGIDYLPDEVITQVVDINLKVAEDFFASTGYSSAFEYLMNADRLMPENKWQLCYPVAFKIHKLLSESAFIISKYDISERFLNDMVENCSSIEDKAEAYLIKINHYVTMGKKQEAIDIGLQALRLFGQKIPREPSVFHVLTTLLRVEFMLRSKSANDILDLPTADDRAVQFIMKILIELAPTVYELGNLNLNVIMMFKCVMISLKYGNSPESSFVYLGYAAIQMHIFGRNERARALAGAALKLCQKFSDPFWQGRSISLYGSMLQHWFDDHHHVQESFLNAMNLSLETGDLLYFAVSAMTVGYIDSSSTIDTILKQSKKFSERYVENFIRGDRNNLKLIEATFLNFQGKTIGPKSLSYDSFDENECFAAMENANYMSGMATFYTQKLQVCFYNGEYQSAFECYTLGQKYQDAITGTYNWFEFIVNGFLTTTQIYESLPKSLRLKHLVKMRWVLKKVRALNQNFSNNIAPSLLLMEAEWARIRRFSVVKVIRLYKEAIDIAREKDFIRYQALANLFFGFYLQKGLDDKAAKLYLKEAIYFFNVWGASRIVSKLEQEFGLGELGGQSQTSKSISGTSISSTSSAQGSLIDHLDFESVLKACLTVSETLDISMLVNRLTELSIENAGAHRGCLILIEDDQLVIRSISSNVQGTDVVSCSTLLNMEDSIPHALINYVYRSKEVLVIDNVAEHDLLHDYKFSTSNPPKSIICHPIISRGQVLGIQYLENNLSYRAFSPDRVKILNVIATQGAISLENSRFYESLEIKVKERTAQLAQKTSDIHNMLQHMRQGIFTILPDKSIHPEYSVYLEKIFSKTKLSDMDALDLLFDKSDLSNDARDQIVNVINLMDDELSYLSNSHLLIKEYKRTSSDSIQYLELDWEPIFGQESGIEKIMVVVKDVTEIRKLRDEAETQKKELNIIGTMLEIRRESIKSFFDSAVSYIEQCEQVIHSGASVSAGDIKILLRNLHTLKGTSRGLGFKDISDLVHDVETEVNKLIEIDRQSWNIEPILNGIQSIRNQIDYFFSIYEKKLAKYFGYDNQGDFGLVEKMQEMVLKFDKNKQSDMAELGNLVALEISKLGTISFEALVNEQKNSLLPILQELGKPMPHINLIGDPLFLDEAKKSFIDGIFTHCFRNSMDHGIESPNERKSNQKDEKGTITLEYRKTDEYIEIKFYDDGKGLDIKRLREKGIQNGCIGPEASDLMVAQTIFNSGVSTAETISDISGRGVGMDAVKSYIEDDGGLLDIQFRGEANAQGKRPFMLLLSLPLKYFKFF